MENEKQIVKYVLWCLKHLEAARMETELDMMLKLFDAFPSYEWSTIINAFCGEEQTC